MMDLRNERPLFEVKVRNKIFDCICSLKMFQAVWVGRKVINTLQQLKKVWTCNTVTSQKAESGKKKRETPSSDIKILHTFKRIGGSILLNI